MYQRLKKSTFEILEARTDSKVSRIITIFILALITLNVVAVILETVESLSNQYSTVFYTFEIVFTLDHIIFTD